MKQFRLPLFVRAGVVVFLVTGFLFGTAGVIFWGQQKNSLLAEQMRAAQHILNFFAASVKIPLLTDDILRLSSVVRDAVELEGISYAIVLDRNQVVKSQSGQDDYEKIRLSASKEVFNNENGTVIMQHVNPLGGMLYDLSTIILYHEKPLGTVHLGLAGSFTEEGFRAARFSLLRSLWSFAVCLILLLFLIVFFYTLRVKQRTRKLIRAVDEYGKGNLHYRIEKIENNESGDVALALHHMSHQLVYMEPSQAKLEQYLKFSALDCIMESPVSQGESFAFRRQVVVLFASIKGFGSYAGTESPENIVNSLNQYISIVTKVISKHGGYVDKVIGDSVVGIFGVSLYRENHTARAVRAAIDLQEALSAGNKNESQLLSNVCVGLSSGIVLSGNIGSYSKIEYSSIGESIKEAYWLSNLGHPGEIILEEEIFSLMKESIEVEALPAQSVLGGTETIKSYRLVSLTEVKNEIEG